MAKILVVEDEVDLREILVGELEYQGHVTLEAENGLEGLAVLSGEMPDLIISDINMPKMTGIQFFRTATEKYPAIADIPFIFLTAQSDRDSELKGLRLGADDYLTKPVDFDILFARVDASLRRRRPISPAPARDPGVAGEISATSKDDERRDDGDEGDQASAEDEDDKALVVGKFLTVSLEAVRERVGDKWEKVAEKILTFAEETIRRHLGSMDRLHVTASQDFLVWFADLDQQEAQNRVRHMRDDIWDRIFLETNDEILSSIEAHSYSLPSIDTDGQDDDVQFYEGIDDIINSHHARRLASSKKTLKRIHKHEEIIAIGVFNVDWTPSNMKMVNFSKKHSDKVDQLSFDLKDEIDALFESFALFVARLKEDRAIKREALQNAVVLPVRFGLMRNPRVRDDVVRLCQGLEASLGSTLLVEVRDLPDRLASHLPALEPLPLSRQLQSVEISRLEQLDKVNLAELRDLGVAFLSMPFPQIIRAGAKRILHLVSKLKHADIKLFIRDIPEGKLFEAQNYEADLYAMRK